jgi:outer membrane protein assembly factor BamB
MAPSRFACSIAFALIIYFGVHSAVLLADWPGLWGPARNGITAGSGTLAGSEPKVLWRRAVAGGYSEIAVQRNRAFTMELHDGVDYVTALDAASGRELWRVRVGPTYRGHGGSDDGPISTPSVEGNDLFALGPRGELIAVDVASGKERWRHDLVSAFGATAPTWGFAASPLIEGRLVIVPTGGPQSRGLLAFDRASGTLVWNAPVSKFTGYASAITATIGGVRQVITVASDTVYAVAPTDGRVIWTAAAFGGKGEVANSPVVLPGDRVLVSNWEESLLIGVSGTGQQVTTREIWRSPRLRGSNGPTIYHDGHLYGFSGAFLIGVNADTGEERWRERSGPGTVIAVGHQLLFLHQESGELQLATMTPEAFRVQGRARVLTPGVRAVTGPSFSEGRLFVRNLKEIVALQMK